RAHRELSSRQQRVELLRAGVDRYQRMGAGIVMVKAAGNPFAVVDGEIELELVAAAAGRVRPHRVLHRTVFAEIGAALETGLDPRGAIEKARKLAEGDRCPAVEARSRRSFAAGKIGCDCAGESLCRSMVFPGQRGRTAGSAGITVA